MKIRSIPVLILLLFYSCTEEIETISIEREGSLTFNVQGYETSWEGKEINVYQGPFVVNWVQGDPSENILFRRYFIVFKGDIPDGGSFELNVSIDIIDEEDMKHNFTREYTKSHGGLSQISLIMKAKGNSELTHAELCDSTANMANFRVLRQNLEEHLIAGTMEADLCLQNSTDTRFVIYNAEFKDINYKQE